MEKTNKDYWKLSSRNFFGLSVATALFQVYAYIGYSNMSAQLGNPGQALPISDLIVSIVLVLLLIFIGILFKKRNPLAIYIAYIFIGLSLVLNILMSLNIIAILIGLYVLYFVYKAQKSL